MQTAYVNNERRRTLRYPDEASGLLPSPLPPAGRSRTDLTDQKMKLLRLLSLIFASTVLLGAMASCSETPAAPAGTPDTDPAGDQTEEDRVIYVDPSAASAGKGSESEPFSSIESAQARIRELKENGIYPEEGITVCLADGYYGPVRFTESDSGSEGAPVTYLSKNRHGAKITGGTRLDPADFEPADPGIASRLIDSSAREKLLQLDLRKYSLTEKDWGGQVSRRAAYSQNPEAELFINGERMLLGQYPNEKWITSTAETDGTEGAGADLIPDEITAEHISKWTDSGDLFIHGYLTVSYFDDSSNITLKDGRITVNDIEGSRITGHVEEHGAAWYWFYNVLEEIDSPGEYYIDRDTGMLYLYEPDDFGSAEILLSTVTGNLAEGTEADYITFKDIVFTASRGEALRFTDCDGLTVDGCLITGIRNSGISIDGMNNTVKDCEVHDIGAYAVGVSGGDGEKLIKSGNLVTNNDIHDFSQILRTYNPGIGLYGCGDTAAHNEIYGAAHTALMYRGQYATFEYNYVHDVCLETMDCGALYAGRSLSWYGAAIRFNRFRDIGSDDIPNRDNYFKATGIYLDDGISGIEVFGNIIENTTGRGIYATGRDTVVSNNIIIGPHIFVIEFDTRMWDAIFTDYGWFPVSNIQNMIKDVRKYLEGENSEIWKENFPALADAVLDYDPAVPDPRLIIAPVNNKVTNNIYANFRSSVIYAEGLKYDIIADRNTISGNFPVTTSAFEDYANGNFTVKSDAGMWNHVPDFEQIEWQKIGIIKE